MKDLTPEELRLLLQAEMLLNKIELLIEKLVQDIKKNE